MFNPKWPTWIYASVIDHFNTVATANNIHLFVEGEARDTSKLAEYVELRINGPTFTEDSKDCFAIDLTIDLLVSVKMGSDEVYRPHTIAGLFINQMIDIAVFDKGFPLPEGDEGDPVPAYSVQFCMSLSDRDRRVRWRYFGQVDPKVALLQGAVNANYRVKL